MNKVVLMGRLAADPELRTTQNGIAVTSFTLAVDPPYVKNGEERQTDWIDVVAWRHTAEFICKYFGKGDPIMVSGTLQSRLWEDKEGNKRKNVEVQLDDAEFVPRQKGDGKQQRKAETETETKPETVNTVLTAEDFIAIDDEDVPF